MEQRGNLVPIGRFSQICRLTIKALRHYDDLGLLKPALVDPQSGYRYYGIEQVATAELIRTLRAVAMPLEEIGAALRVADPETIREALTRHRDRLLARIVDQQGAVALIERLLTREEQPMSYTIQLTEVLQQRVAVKRLTIPPSALSTVIPEEIGVTAGLLARHGVATAGPPIVSYHEGMPEDEAMTIEVGWPIAGDFAGAGELLVGTLGGGLAAQTTHIGPFEEVSAAWGALGRWVQARGHEGNGIPWESYVTDPVEEPDPANYRTDIIWPVR